MLLRLNRLRRRRVVDGSIYRRLRGEITEAEYIAILNEGRARHRLPKVTINAKTGTIVTRKLR